MKLFKRLFVFIIIAVMLLFTLGACDNNKDKQAILLPNITWYKGETQKNSIEKIEIYDKITIKKSQIKEKWNADLFDSGSVKCYILKDLKTLVISGNGSGFIKANADSSRLFSGDDLSSCFTSLTTITGLEVLDTSEVITFDRAFNYCTKLSGTINLSTWNMANVKNTNIMFQMAGDLANAPLNILLPNSLKCYNSVMFNHNSTYSEKSFIINKNVEDIGYIHMWYSLGTKIEKTQDETRGKLNTNVVYSVENPFFEEFLVEEGNENFKSVDGILYDIKGERLIAVPAGKTFENYTYAILEGTTWLNELCFSRTRQIYNLIIPNSYNIILDFTPNQYPLKTINEGNSLNVAVYNQTSIKNYIIKEDNLNYLSYEGCVYSKDGSELIAVPSAYSGVEDNGVLNVKEGTKKILKYAIYHEVFLASDKTESFGLKINKITIPKSVEFIDEEQKNLINKLALNNDIIIEIDKDNTFYKVIDNQIV